LSLNKLKVAFLINDYKCSPYVYDLICHVAQQDGFSVPVLIHVAGKTSEKSRITRLIARAKKAGWFGAPNAVLSMLLTGFVRRVERRIFANSSINDSNIDVRTIPNHSVANFDGVWSKSGIVLRFSDADISAIEGMHLDCLIRCGSGILKGKILDVTRLGVLSFHHGDNRVNRGGPSGFWEVLFREPSSGFIIQTLNGELDGGTVLVRGNIMTSNTWTSNNARLLRKSNVFFEKLLDQIAETGQLPQAEPPILHDRPLYKMDKSSTLLRYLCCIIFPLAIKKIAKKIISPKVSRWSVSYAIHENFSKSLWRYKEIKNPEGRFFADPFIFNHAERDIIFVEDFCYTDNKGRISAIEIVGDSEKILGVVLEEEFHLSYPFVFEFSGAIYMIPETHEVNEIRLYECIDFPLKWKLKKVLMQNVSAADSMVIRKDGAWFLLTNICSAGLADHNSELHIFHSKELLSGDWVPLSVGNPVLMDSEIARNGGLFESNGDLYRVNQIHGKAHYGKAFGINKITQLDINSYNEERLKTVMPFFRKGLTGTHHFHANRRFAVNDFSRKERFKDILDGK
jgi:hypothetical protein